MNVYYDKNNINSLLIKDGNLITSSKYSFNNLILNSIIFEKNGFDMSVEKSMFKW